MDRSEPSSAIDPVLLEQAARLRLDIRGMTEIRLRLHLQKIDPAGAEARARRWAEENAEAIKEHNEAIARRGLIGAEWRRW